ncbi:HupE/UreJ family protein [Legionella sp. WA2022007384]
MRKITHSTALSTFLIVVLSVVPTMVYAHHAEFMRDAPFLQGLSMPIHGVDHMLFTFAVGLIAAQIGGRALWSIPLVFSMAMLLGGILNLSGVSIPLLEYAILASIVVCGALLSLNTGISLLAIVGIIAVFTFFNGNGLMVNYSSLMSMPAFILGCLISSLFLLGVGVGAGLLISRFQASMFRYVGVGVLAAAIVIAIFPNLNGLVIHLLEV